MPLDELPDAVASSIRWDAGGVTVGDKRFDGAMVAFVYPTAGGERLAAYVAAAEGFERLLYRYVPFSSRAGMPDFIVLGDDGLLASGFFDADWKLAPAFASGL